VTAKDQYLGVMGAAVMSLATDAIFIIDATTLRLVEANRAFTRAFGYARDVVPQLSLFDLVATERARVDENLEKLASDGELMLGVWPYRAIDGTIVEMESRVGVAVIEGRKLYCVVARDLTPMRQAERSLRDSEERFRKLADVAFEGIAITEAGRIIDVNQRCCELLRASYNELIGREVKEFVAPESREKVQVHARADTDVPYEHMALRADGTLFPVEVQAKSIIQGGRQLRVTALRDVSQRKSLEEQVRLAQRMESVGRLAGGIAHDFNNLLTVILSLTDLMRESPNSETNAADLAGIAAAAERASALTRQLLAFARQQIIELKIVSLNGVVQELDTMLRRVLGEDIEFATRSQSDLGWVRADSGQIEQVLMNLVINGRDAMTRGGVLTIETANVTLGDDYVAQHPEVAAGDFVMVSVSDTGVGMDAATMRHIFEPFFTTKPPGKGTGLGLATCYGIVQQHGGSIGVDSEPGIGTRFRVYLPRVWDAAPANVPQGVDVSLAGNETLLVVEDDALVRHVAVRVLEGLGYRIIEAAHGAQALSLYQARNGPIDLVVTDVVLPGMSGKELADKLRQAQPDIKILYTSGYAEDTIVHQGVVDQGVHFLAKPYVPSELARRVRQVLDVVGDE
jgi:two-component system cell cycle sensor histidine kinase/response regulator CckA